VSDFHAVRAIGLIIATLPLALACGGARIPEPRAVRAGAASRAGSPSAAPAKPPSASATATTKPKDEEKAPVGPPPLDAEWGTVGPLSLVAAAPDRRWLVVCQARRDTDGDGAVRVDVGAQGELRGDALDGFVIDGPGPGFPVDAFAGSDPSGRFVAFVRDGHLVLRDTTTHLDTELGPGADVRDDLGSFVHPRALAFDEAGKRVLYLQTRDSGARIVVRELATGAEASIDPGPGELWRADFDPSGEWVVARVVTTDTNKNGRIDWTVHPAPGPWMRCAGPLPRYAAWERPGDEPEARLAPASGGTAVAVPGLVIPLGQTRLERDTEGALAFVRDGKRTVIAEKTCESRVIHADAGRGAAIVTCLDKKGHSEARLVTQGGTKPLGFALSAAAGDRWIEDAPRLVPLQPGNDAVLVDLERGTTEMLTSGDRILTTAGTRALVLRGKTLVLHELGGAERALPGEVTPLAHVVHAGPVWYVPPFVIDVASGELIGKSDARALAVSSDGALLVAGGTEPLKFVEGPLRWKAPVREEH